MTANSIDSISISATVMTDHVNFNGVDNLESNNSKVLLPTERPIDLDTPKEITMEQVLQKTQLALLFDIQHLPARTYLAMLYREIGDIAQSEFHLQLACTASRHRGTAGGKSGMTSCFGGYTSNWGWYSWNLLSLIFKDQGRYLDAQKAALFAVQSQKQSCIRGYECLSRFPA
jgi:hypothetical protein